MQINLLPTVNFIQLLRSGFLSKEIAPAIQYRLMLCAFRFTLSTWNLIFAFQIKRCFSFYLNHFMAAQLGLYFRTIKGEFPIVQFHFLKLDNTCEIHDEKKSKVASVFFNGSSCSKHHKLVELVKKSTR